MGYKSPLTDEWINKIWYIHHTTEYYSVIKTNKVLGVPLWPSGSNFRLSLLWLRFNSRSGNWNSKSHVAEPKQQTKYWYMLHIGWLQPGIKPRSPTLQVASLPTELSGKPKPWKHYAKWKKPATKVHKLSDSFYITMSRLGKSITTESRLEVTKGWGGESMGCFME